VSDIVVEVGVDQVVTSLAVALAGLQNIASWEPSADRIVLLLRDAIASHPPGPLQLPEGIGKLLIRGRGTPTSDAEAAPTAGVLHTTVWLPDGSGDIRPQPGSDIEYQDLRFIVGERQPRSLFLQDAGASILRFRNCVADGGSPSTDAQVFARLSGSNDRLLADGLRVGLGFTHAIDARTDPSHLATSPMVDLRRCGFRGLQVAVRCVNLSHARVRDSVFADCGTGLWITLEPGAAPGGLIHIADNQFRDCARGAILQDRSRTAGVAGESPPDNRQFAGDVPNSVRSANQRRRVRFLRNEFRAPDVSAYPEIPKPLGDAWGIREHETVGLRADFDPHSASGFSEWPAQLLLQSNVFHLLDHGLGLSVGQHGQAVVDHCTFVANSVRSIFVQEVATSQSRDLGLAITRNLFQAIGSRPWLGRVEGTPPLSSRPSRYRFGGVELWGAFSDLAMRERAWVASNVFADFGAEHPRIFALVSGFGAEAAVEVGAWEGAVTSGAVGIVTWANRRWDDVLRAIVLRLPRIRHVQGDRLTMVEFDYHAALGAAAALPGESGLQLGPKFDLGWLAGRSVQLSEPQRDYHGESMGFHHLTPELAGAGRERRRWQGWPLLAWAANEDHLTRTVDATHRGVPYFVHKTPAAEGQLGLDELEFVFNGVPPTKVTDLIAYLDTVDHGGVLVRVDFYALADCQYHDGPCSQSGALAEDSQRVFLIPGGGQVLELPVRNSDSSFDGGEWSQEFVNYWLGLLKRYVLLLTAADPNNRIAGWMMGDENPVTSASVLELMARAHDVIQATDPLRRPVFSGTQSSDAVPHRGGLPTAIGGVVLHADQNSALSSRGWNPPSWTSQRGAALFLDREPRALRGSLLPATRVYPDQTCLIGELGAAIDDPDPACKDDFGVILAAPLDAFGRPRFTSHHVTSSWHYNRSIELLHSENRSYAHHHGLVLRDTLEIAMLYGDRSLTRVRQDGHTFFNAPVLLTAGLAQGVPNTLGSYRHDFWAGIHHAGGVFAYVLNQYVPPGTLASDAPPNLFSRAFDEGMELLKGTNPMGTGLREALANGERWQTLRAGDPGPPWLASWSHSPQSSENIDFGPQAGRTLGERGPGYLDIGTTVLRLGSESWLIITNSRPFDRWIQFQHDGDAEILNSGAATLATGVGGLWELRFRGYIDAVVLRLSAK